MTTPRQLLPVLLLLIASNVAAAQSDDAERLRLHGSNLLGDKLVPTLVEGWLKDIGYEQIKRRERGATRTEFSATRDGQGLVVEIDKRGTASGLKAIIDGEADISLSSRQPSAQELEAAWQLGDLKSPTQEWVLGLDGVIVLVSPDNPLSEISIEQLRDVASGKLHDWAQLGGRPGPIAAHSLAAGTQEALVRLVPGMDPRMPGVKRYRDPAAVVTAVQQVPGSIGLVGLRAPRGSLKALAIRSGGRAVAPDALGLASEDYPLLRRMYFHTGQLMTALGRGFAQYVTSPAGQAVVARSQFVSLALQPMAPGKVGEGPDEYRKLVATARRLPMTVRFGKGLDLLDSRSRQDLERLASFLQRPENAGRRLLLMGFANPQPKLPMQSLFLSQERADYVASELLAINLKVVSVRGFGGQMKLANPAQPSARDRNDRVEVWLR